MVNIKIKMQSNHLLLGVILFLLFFGGVIPFFGFKLFGMTLTFYRVGMPIIFASLLIKRFFIDKNRFKGLSKTLLIFLGFIVVWIIYGIMGIIISEYSPFKEGMIEILSLCLGALSIFCLYENCHDVQDIKVLLMFVKVYYTCICIIAIVELFFNVHLPTSRYYYSGKSLWNDILEENTALYLSTGTFYGVNDFSTFLSVFFPLFMLNIQYRWYKNLYHFIVITIVFVLLGINDANIALFAILLGSIVYMVLSGRKWLKNGISILYLAMMQWFGLQYIQAGLLRIKRLFYSRINIVERPFVPIDQTVNDAIVNSSSTGATTMSDSLETQVGTFLLGTGSLKERVNLMSDAWNLTWETYGLGAGPGGFAGYYTKHSGKGTIPNPHNWWLELLSQYGVLVFLGYLSFCVVFVIKMIKLYLKTRQEYIKIVIAMCFSFALACISPSSFIGYSYPWILFTLCIISFKINSLKFVE